MTSGLPKLGTPKPELQGWSSKAGTPRQLIRCRRGEIDMRVIIATALMVSLTGFGADAQGVKDPSTPNGGSVILVNPPQQPDRPTATPNIPPASAAPAQVVRRVYPYQSPQRTTVGRR
jgi:hypothetical protein